MKAGISKILSILLVICLFFQLPVNVLAAEKTDDGPQIDVTYDVKDQIATFHITTSGTSKIKKVSYLWGDLLDPYNDVWDEAGNDITGKKTVTTKNEGEFTFRVEDVNGKASTVIVNVVKEFHAVWISYLEFKSTGYTKSEFTKHVSKMFESVKSMGMNAVVVQVRPFGDAMYPSKYFPWSVYVSGKQGKDPGFDPLEIMIKEAHDRNLEFHAWINPYRITTNNTDFTKLDNKNPAKKWLTDSSTTNDRNVLSFNGNLYYNPASYQVRSLIVNGVNEIVRNYDVDGIHFDDYFYPALGKNYKNVFDNIEYEAYTASCTEKGITSYLSISDWRRRNVNYLVKSVYTSINALTNDVVFGISPIGNIDTLTADDRYYCDIKTWMSKSGYIDYICPQVYWSFEHSTAAFDEVVKRWKSIKKHNNVSLYIGIPVYKAGSALENQFYKDPDILADMITYCRDLEGIDGFLYFRYNYFFNSVTKKAVQRLLAVLK